MSKHLDYWMGLSKLATSRAVAAETALAAAQVRELALREALTVLKTALDDGHTGQHWDARKFLEQRDVYDGDLNGTALLFEVARVALAAPSDDAALRALLLEIRKRAKVGGSFAVEYVDAVLAKEGM